jgi:hypothetical protein
LSTDEPGNTWEGNQILIGIGHRSDHGKDTVANYMIEWLGFMRPDLEVKKLSWAWKLKDVTHQLYGYLGLREPEFYETPEGRALRHVKLPCINLTPVEIWIKFATDGVRNQVWDRTWVEWVRAHSLDYDVIICPDTRFHNEIEVCDWTVKVHNPRKPPMQGASSDEYLAGYDGWDFTITNDLGLSELRGRAFDLANHLFNDFKLP